MAEVYDSKNEIKGYLAVSRSLKLVELTKARFANLVASKCVNNYYSTDAREIRRMPNQNVSKAVLFDSVDCVELDEVHRDIQVVGELGTKNKELPPNNIIEKKNKSVSLFHKLLGRK